MSRSRHETVKGVFGGKSKKEIKQMISDSNPDVQELRRKIRYKIETRYNRQNNS